MEQIKILEIINRWGYLNAYQIALLLNKDMKVKYKNKYLKFIQNKTDIPT